MPGKSCQNTLGFNIINLSIHCTNKSRCNTTLSSYLLYTINMVIFIFINNLNNKKICIYLYIHEEKSKVHCKAAYSAMLPSPAVSIAKRPWKPVREQKNILKRNCYNQLSINCCCFCLFLFEFIQTVIINI